MKDHVDYDHLTLHGADPSADGLSLLDDDGVVIIVTQAFGPRGDDLVGISGVSFDGFPAITLRVRAAGQDGLVHLSPVHGDRRKLTDLTLDEGTRCELLCPVSGEPLPRAEASDDDPDCDYYALYLTPKLSGGDAVLVSNLWGHYHSRVVDNFELLSSYAGDE